LLFRSRSILHRKRRQGLGDVRIAAGGVFSMILGRVIVTGVISMIVSGVIL